ncbi:MAG: GvpL/GvpF family gas vesicle protein [Deltaproteobacteria bacterium]
MSAPMSNSIWYVYGIVSSEMPETTLPVGLDDSGVALERHDRIAALVSVLEGGQYAPAALETNSGDVEWLSPRAVAHDRVLTWASDHGAVVPLPMFSLFSGQRAVHAMLRERSSQLSSTLASVARGREYALRVYRVDAELLAAVASLSPRLGEMAKNAEAASPGQRYLLERKLDGEKKAELRSVSQRIVEEIVSELEPHALRMVRSPIPRAADGETATRGTMVLNAAFLIAPDRFAALQSALTSLVERHGAHGFRFDFTGPWPPYHFVNEPAHDE